MSSLPGHIAFTDAVKAEQARHGSREAYAKMEARGAFRTAIDADLIAFLGEVDTAYLATASADGRPYAQHRGGPRGFIRVLDENTLAFADFSGNKQYISTGNLAENGRAFLFLMDYAHARRIKIWGRARMVDADPALIASLMPAHYKARGEQALLFTVEAWDSNCSQHIPRKLDGGEVAALIDRFEARIATLEAENTALKTRLNA